MFVSKYTDDGAEIFTKYGDDAIAAVNACDAPYKAVQIIKNGGTQYGEQAVQAIKKSGDKAVEALTKVPTKDCAEIISKINNNVIDLINKLDVDEAKRFLETVHKQDDSLIKILNESSDSENYVSLITKYNDDGIDIVNLLEVNRPKLKTNINTAFFWSGRTDGIGGEEVAKKIAKDNGGTTLELMIENNGIKMPEWSDDPIVQVKWGEISRVYAEQVEGEVRAVVGESLREGNIWETIELPRLMNNPNVTKIITIDPKTLKEKVIFVR